MTPPRPETPDATTDDALLAGRVVFRQPQAGYRAAIDPVLLAARIAIAVPVKVPAGKGANTAGNPERVLDLGCGAGAAMLCLAARVAGLQVDGLELQPGLVRLARHNIVANDLQGRVRVFLGDLLQPPGELEAGAYHQVIANPPYQTAAAGHPPPDAARRTAHVEGAAALGDWVAAATRYVRRKGRVTFIYHGERLAELLSELHVQKGEKAAGEITVLPLLPHAGAAASRVIVSWRAGVKTPFRLLPGLVLHEADGAYTAAVRAALQGKPLAG